jgi:hypothetical protein
MIMAKAVTSSQLKQAVRPGNAQSGLIPRRGDLVLLGDGANEATSRHVRSANPGGGSKSGRAANNGTIRRRHSM